MQDSDRTAVTAYEWHIIAAEGPRTVEGTYYPRENDADLQRRWAAERMVREARRQDAREREATSSARARVGTWLAPRERARVDVAVGANFIHRDTLHAVRGDLITGRVDAVLISTALVRPPDVATLSAIVRDFPGTPIVGLVADIDESQALAGALAFGQAGVRNLIDGRTAAGWAALRSAFDVRRLPDAFLQRAIRELTQGPTIGEASCTAGWSHFLSTVFSPRVSSAKQVAAILGVGCSTLTSRFHRAELPSPKCYVAHARLVWAARLAEAPGMPISAIAHRLDASSPQSFGRMVRHMVGVTASTFRQQFDGAAMLDRYRAALIDPYRDTLRTFDPLRATHGERAAQSGKHLTGRAA
ncbi:MAG: helix-turn-helix domain-containing protein [Gemmatimonadaceae bacterium]